MKKKLLSFLGIILATICLSQNKTALIVGINKYSPPQNVAINYNTGRDGFDDLDGTKNDALAIKSVIQTKFDFKEENIRELYDDQATRDNILSGLNDLMKRSNKGDIAFFYYSGHGSQQFNSRSREPDKADETIVPSNCWQKGVGDIRDKELAKIFNAFLDKGIRLTVIFDCCHSGSMTRSLLFQAPKIRFLEMNRLDANDPSDPVPPETREGNNFLYIFASQDNESAKEQEDDNGVSHGAFTLAFLQALRQQSVNTSAMNLLEAARAILKFNHKAQEPDLAGSMVRKQETLFGIPAGTLADKFLIPVKGIHNKVIELQAGFAQGIYPEQELTMVRDNSVVVVIDSVTGINKCAGSISRGNISKIQPGELFEITNWVSSQAPLLKIYIPPSSFSNDDIKKLTDLDLQLRRSDKLNWVNDLDKTEPYATVFFRGNSLYVNKGGRSLEEIKDYRENDIIAAADRQTLFFNLPASREVTAVIRQKLEENLAISLVSNPSDAHYFLYGTITNNGSPAYGLVSSQVSARDSLGSMPVQTQYFDIPGNSPGNYENCADSIFEYAIRLSRIRGWLNLDSPPLATFPFHMELVNEKTQKALNSLEYKVGDAMSLHLVADQSTPGQGMPQKYIYVFVIDRKGNMMLTYPDPESGNQENKFPKFNGKQLIADTVLFTFNVTEPVGTDNFFLLASNEPIINYARAFNQAGVLSEGKRKIPVSFLENIINLGNEQYLTRAFNKSPANWCLLRLSVRSRKK